MQCDAIVADSAMKGGGPNKKFCLLDSPAAAAAVTFVRTVQYLSFQRSKAKRRREFFFVGGKTVVVETIGVLRKEGSKEQSHQLTKEQSRTIENNRANEDSNERRNSRQAGGRCHIIDVGLLQLYDLTNRILVFRGVFRCQTRPMTKSNSQKELLATCSCA